jgi:hypothetical protein
MIPFSTTTKVTRKDFATLVTAIIATTNDTEQEEMNKVQSAWEKINLTDEKTTLLDIAAHFGHDIEEMNEYSDGGDIMTTTLQSIFDKLTSTADKWDIGTVLRNHITIKYHSKDENENHDEDTNNKCNE